MAFQMSLKYVRLEQINFLIYGQFPINNITTHECKQKREIAAKGEHIINRAMTNLKVKNEHKVENVKSKIETCFSEV